MKTKHTVASIIFFLTVLIMLVSCQKQMTGWKGIIEKEDGIIIVKNSKEPMYSDNIFYLEEDLSIGHAYGEKEYMFTRLWYLIIDHEENIYAMDRGENHVKVFDKKGALVRTIGEKGEGPGS